MRNFLLVLNIVITLGCFGQNDSIKNLLIKERVIVDCQIISLNAVDLLAENLNANTLVFSDNTVDILENWKMECGTNEPLERIRILIQIQEKKNITPLVESYLNKHYDHLFHRRFALSSRPDSLYSYSENKSYYSFVPLGHPIDKISQQIALQLLGNPELSTDAHLFCLLISGDVQAYYQQAEKKKNKNSTTGAFFQKEINERRRERITINIFSGVFLPLGKKNNVFSPAHIFGFGFSTPVNFPLQIGFNMKVRLTPNDKNFNYYALNATNNINAKEAIYGGVFLGYKVYNKSQFMVIPKFGFGIESTNTGLQDKGPNNNSKTNYHNLETMHTSLGICFLSPIFRDHFIGLELHYHYIPFQLDTNLKTPINTNYLSTELVFKF